MEAGIQRVEARLYLRRTACSPPPFLRQRVKTRMKNRNPFAIRIWRLETRSWKLEDAAKPIVGVGFRRGKSPLPSWKPRVAADCVVFVVI